MKQMNDKYKIALANLILDFLKDSGGKSKDLPIMIGTLNKSQGINGFKKAEVGNPVFLLGDRYVIFLESLDGKTSVEIPYHKETLKPFIQFTDCLE